MCPASSTRPSSTPSTGPRSDHRADFLTGPPLLFIGYPGTATRHRALGGLASGAWRPSHPSLSPAGPLPRSGPLQHHNAEAAARLLNPRRYAGWVVDERRRYLRAILGGAERPEGEAGLQKASRRHGVVPAVGGVARSVRSFHDPDNRCGVQSGCLESERLSKGKVNLWPGISYDHGRRSGGTGRPSPGHHGHRRQAEHQYGYCCELEGSHRQTHLLSYATMVIRYPICSGVKCPER